VRSAANSRRLCCLRSPSGFRLALIFACSVARK
jgi:hypothetical protein